MTDQDNAAGNAQEALALAENLGSMIESLKDFVDTARTALGDSPKDVAQIGNSINTSMVVRSRQVGETAENVEDHIKGADETERFDDTTEALQHMDSVKTEAGNTAAVLDEAAGFAEIARKNLVDLAGALTTASYSCDPMTVEVLAARNNIEAIIRRLSS